MMHRYCIVKAKFLLPAEVFSPLTFYEILPFRLPATIRALDIPTAIDFFEHHDKAADDSLLHTFEC